MSRHDELPRTIAETEAAIKRASSAYDSAEDDKEEAENDMARYEEQIDQLAAHLAKQKKSHEDLGPILDRLLHFITLQHGGGDLALITAVIAGESLDHSQTLRLGQLRTMYLL